MIRATRPRSLRQMLILPITDEEQQLANDHVARACAEVRSRWTEAEHRCRWRGISRHELDGEFYSIPEGHVSACDRQAGE